MSIYDTTAFAAAAERLALETTTVAPGARYSQLAPRFLQGFQQLPAYAPYYHVSADAQDVVGEARAVGGEAAVAQLLRCALLTAVSRVEEQLRETPIPSSIQMLYPRHLDRIVADLLRLPAAFYSLSNDLFIKDLCICTLRMYPVGGRLLEPHCGLSRRLPLMGGIGQAPRAFYDILRRLGGFRPLVQFHTHTSDLGDFSAEGMIRTYHRVADFLADRPRLLGLYSASWFNDPAVSDISPRLAYLRETPTSNGAFLVRGLIDDNATASALSRSATRRALYDSGAYQPRVYYMIWPRDALIQWSRSVRSPE